MHLINLSLPLAFLLPLTLAAPNGKPIKSLTKFPILPSGFPGPTGLPISLPPISLPPFSIPPISLPPHQPPYYVVKRDPEPEADLEERNLPQKTKTLNLPVPTGLPISLPPISLPPISIPPISLPTHQPPHYVVKRDPEPEADLEERNLPQKTKTLNLPGLPTGFPGPTGLPISLPPISLPPLPPISLPPHLPHVVKRDPEPEPEPEAALEERNKPEKTKTKNPPGPPTGFPGPTGVHPPPFQYEKRDPEPDNDKEKDKPTKTKTKDHGPPTGFPGPTGVTPPPFQFVRRTPKPHQPEAQVQRGGVRMPWFAA